MRVFLLGVSLALVGCKGDGSAGGDSGQQGSPGDSGGGGGGEQQGYPSSFTTGKFRTTDFVLLPSDQGKDFDGDGEVDNNLPALLDYADGLMGDTSQLSTAELNTTIAGGISDGSQNIMFDATYADRELSLLVLNADYDEASGKYTINSASYDGAGDPVSVFTGNFSDETTFAASADSVKIPVIFVAGDPPVLVPLVLASIEGDLSDDGSEGFLYGVIPSDEMVNDVIAPMIDDAGVDTDGDGTPDMSKDQVLSFATAIVGSETQSDYEFEDGSRGVTAAFSYKAAPADW